MEQFMSTLATYFVPVIAGICLCLAWAYKKIDHNDRHHDFIPMGVMLLGIVLAAWLHNWQVTPDVILAGAFSGLASTGFYEMLTHLIEEKVVGEHGEG